MDNAELNIEEIRDKCNQVIDMLKVELTKVKNSGYEKMTKFLNDNRGKNVFVDGYFEKKERERNRVVSDSFLSKIAYAAKVGLNIFAMTVLKIDREFLDFSFYKTEREKKPKFDSFFGGLDVLGDAIVSLDDIKEKINIDDKEALLFYRGIMGVNQYNFWNQFYKVIENMNVDVKYDVEVRKIFWGIDEKKNCTPDGVIESKIFEILGNNVHEKSSFTR